ncbi:monodehydroascorbate reductase, partial [Tanacetum coccineum]
GEEVSDPDSPAPKLAKATKPKASKQSKPLVPKATTKKPKPTPAKPQEKKRKLVTKTSEAPSPAKRSKAQNEPTIGDEEADLQKAVEESLKEVHSARQGLLPLVVIREPESGKFQPLPEVQEKGKEKVSDEQVALDLLNLQTLKKKSPADYETDSDEEVLGIVARVQDEGQAGPNPGDAEASQPPSSHVVHAGPNLEHMDLEAFDTSIQPNPEQMDEEFTTSLQWPIQITLSSLQNLNKELSVADQFLMEKSQEDEPEKTNTESEVQSMVTVPIHQDTSSIPLMTTPVINLTVSQPVPTARIDDLEQHMADLVSKAVDEVVMNAVDWAIQGPLMDRFIDLPEADMKEILHHRMWESNSYQAHEDHKMLYEALEKSMVRDHTDQLLTDLVEAQRKKKKRLGSPKTPPGSPPYQPPPPSPPAGLSGTPGASGASRSSQLPPPPPPSYTNQSDQSTSTAAPSSSITAASAEYTTWTTTDTRLKPSVLSIPEELHIDDDTTHDEQVQSSGDEDIGHDHIPTVNLRQNWWKPRTEDRPATPEPAWSIPSSIMPVLVNNWASALASTYAPPSENSLLAQTGDMAIFMDWFYKKQGITELKQQDLEGPAYEIVKVFHPNVIHLQYQIEECHKLLSDQVDESIIRYNVSKPLPLGGPPGQVIIQSDFFFNKDLEYLRYGHKSGRPALSISKMKAAYYPNVGLEQMVPDQIYTSEGDRRAVQTHMRILSVVRIEVFSLYGYDYMKTIVLRRADLKEYTIAEIDFKYLYPSDFEDLYQTQLNLTKPRWDATGFEFKHDFTVIDTPRAVTFRDKYGVQMIMQFNEIHKFSDITLQQVDEALDYLVKEFKKQLKTRRIFRNLESFVGGRIRERDYRLLKRTE